LGRFSEESILPNTTPAYYGLSQYGLLMTVSFSSPKRLEEPLAFPRPVPSPRKTSLELLLPPPRTAYSSPPVEDNCLPARFFSLRAWGRSTSFLRTATRSVSSLLQGIPAHSLSPFPPSSFPPPVLKNRDVLRKRTSPSFLKY